MASAERMLGLKPVCIVWALRGAEAPLFHGGARFCEFLRNLPSAAEAAVEKSGQ